jgi:hypothetical protein
MAELLKKEKGYIVDQKTGLMIPIGMNSKRIINASHPLSEMPGDNTANGITDTAKGLKLQFDPETMILKLPPYGSGWDDLVAENLARGRILNGFDQLPDTLLAVAITKRQAIVGNWSIVVTGKTSPVNQTFEIISMAEDGEGAVAFSQNFIGALDVHNAGAFVATVPLNYDIDAWETMGMRIVPIGEETKFQSKKEATSVYLDMDMSAYRSNRGLWTIDRQLCQPTGNPHWPYWIYKYSNRDKKFYRVLIPRPFGIQKIQRVGPRSTKWAGYGQSGTWRFMPYIVRNFLVTRGDFERMIAKPPMGLMIATGVDTVGQFNNMMTEYAQDLKANDQRVFPGVGFMEFEEVSAKVTAVPWYQPPEGYTPASWSDLRVKQLAAAFHMSETQFQITLGDGARSQSDVASTMEAESTMAWLLKQLHDIYQEVSLPRVLVTIINPSDRQKSLQAETASKISDTVLKLEQSRMRSKEPETVFTRSEIRRIIEAYIGIPIESESEETYSDASPPAEEESLSVGEAISNVLSDSKWRMEALRDALYEETPLPFLEGESGIKFLESLGDSDLAEFIDGLNPSEAARLYRLHAMPLSEAVRLGYEFAAELITIANSVQPDPDYRVLLTRVGYYICNHVSPELGKG